VRNMPILLPVLVASPFWWSFTALMLCFFSGLTLHCTPAQSIAVPLADGSFYLLCVYQQGDDVLTQFQIDGAYDTAAAQANFNTCCGVLALLAVLYRLAAMLLLYRMAWKVKDATKATT